MTADRVVRRHAAPARGDGRAAGRTTHRSRRYGRAGRTRREVGLALTGTHLTVLTRGRAAWTARGRVDLRDRRRHPRRGLAGRAHRDSDGAVTESRVGRFGQLGLRDVRLVTHADGTPYRAGDRVLLTATSAGPGFFDTAHTSVWSLDPATLEPPTSRTCSSGAPTARARTATTPRTCCATATGGWSRPAPGATSTAGAGRDGPGDARRDQRRPADRRAPARHPAAGPADRPGCARSASGTRTWSAPTTAGWSATSAPRAFFRFHPALATGPTSTRSRCAPRRPTGPRPRAPRCAHLDGDWRVLASDGRDGRRGQRERYPVFDLDLRETGTVDAPYPSNIPWPTLVPDGDSWLLVSFNGTVVRRAAAGLRHARRPGVPAPGRRVYRVTQDTAPPLPCPRQRHTTPWLTPESRTIHVRRLRAGL